MAMVYIQASLSKGLSGSAGKLIMHSTQSGRGTHKITGPKEDLGGAQGATGTGSVLSPHG